jgi:allantoin racemase
LRILLINPNTTTRITEMIAERARAVAGDNVTFVPVTARFGAHYIASRATALIAGHAALDALAEHIGSCDGVYLACFGDPGLAALRELSPAPVIGMAEAACLEACRLGARFSIVTGGALWEPMLREYVATLGLADRLAGIRVITATGDRIAQDPDTAIVDLKAVVDESVRVDGANVVVLGGAGLAGMAARLQPGVSVPVLCSVETGAKAAISTVRDHMRIKCDGPIPALASVGLTERLESLLGSPPGWPGP